MPELLPLFPLSTVLVPGARLPLRIFEPRYLALLRDLVGDPEHIRPFGVVPIRQGHEVGPDAVERLYHVGCTAVIDQAAPIGRGTDGRMTYALVATGHRRFTLHGTDPDAATPYPLGRVSWLTEPLGDPERVAHLAEQTHELLARYRAALPADPVAALPTDPTALSYRIGDGVVLDLADQYALLAAPSTEDRLALGARLLRRETALVERFGTIPVRPDLARANPN